MALVTITDAKTLVGNSGVVDWDWGDGRDSTVVLDQFARFIWRNYPESTFEITNGMIGRFVTEVLGDKLSDYNLSMRDILDDCEREGGACPVCGTPAILRVCHECGKEAWIIDCGHYDQPRPIAPGRKDGGMNKTFCEDCAEILPETKEDEVREAIDRGFADADLRCEVCGKILEYEIDGGEETVWFSCPVYLEGKDPNSDRHSSFGWSFQWTIDTLLHPRERVKS